MYLFYHNKWIDYFKHENAYNSPGESINKYLHYLTMAFMNL